MRTVGRRAGPATLLVLLLLLLFAPARAAVGMPAHPDLLRQARHDKRLAARIAAFERNASAKGIDAPAGRPAAKLPGAASLVPSMRVTATTGTLRSIALLVDFPDKARAVAATSFDSLLFGDVFGPSSLRGYYREVSYGSPTAPGLLTVTTEHRPSAIGKGWLRLPRTLEYYLAGGENGTGSYPNNCQRMVEDAVALADPYVDFSRYDNDGDGEVDNLFVIHAGRGAELTGSAEDIWSHSWSTQRPLRVDGVDVSVYSTEPEYWIKPGDMTTGVFAHEMGHVLGLPDLYDRDYSSAGIGEWSLMAAGSWNGPNDLGGSPARFDAWCAQELGWLRPQVVTGDPALRSLGDVAASRTSAYKLYPDGGTSGSEYFLVENRQRTGTDAALPGSGLLVWHVDETRDRDDDGYRNDTESHKLVDLEEAAGEQSLDFCDAGGWPNVAGADDPYPGSSGNRTFNDATRPGARLYSGSASAVVIDQVGNSAAVMTARFGSGSDGTADTTPPTVEIAGAQDDGYSDREVVLTLTASDDRGVAAIRYALDGVSHEVAAASVEIPIKAVPNGLHVLSYHARDLTGNECRESTFRITIDTGGPVGLGRNASVRKGRYVALRYLFQDAFSPRVRDVKVRVRNRSGRIVWSKNLGALAMKPVDVWNAVKWRPRARGTFRYAVTCRDSAGNAQARKATGTVRVR